MVFFCLCCWQEKNKLQITFPVLVHPLEIDIVNVKHYRYAER